MVWDCSPNTEQENRILNVIDCHVDMIYSLAFNRDGSLIATTSKDKKLRVIEPRSGIVISEGICHNGTKCSKVVFLDNEKVLTTGFSKHSDRQYAIWNQHDLKKPLVMEMIDSSSGILQPLFDYDTKMLYLAGKGDGNIRYYEIVDEPPYIHYLTQFLSGHPQKGLGFMPKRGVNVSQCEVFRFYKLHATGNICEPISMIVPRKSTSFQSDLYPDTASMTPATTCKEWLLGRNVNPILMSMQTGENIYDVVAKKLTNGVKKSASIKSCIALEEEKKKTIERKKSVDNNSKKFAFLAESTVPDYRTQNDKTTDKQQKTTTNQTTKFHQLQLIFGQQHPQNNTKEINNLQNNSLLLHNNNSTSSSKNSSTENINLIHTENEVRFSIFFVGQPRFFITNFVFAFFYFQLKKIINRQSDEIKNLKNQLKTSEKRVKELEFEVKKLQIQSN